MPTGMAFWGFLTSSPARSKGSAGGSGPPHGARPCGDQGLPPAPQTTTPTSPGTVFSAFTLMVGKEDSPPSAENTREAREPGLFGHQDDGVFSGPMSPGGCTGLQSAAANAILPARRGLVVSFRVPLPVRPATRGVMKRKISRKVRTHTVPRRERAATGTHARPGREAATWPGGPGWAEGGGRTCGGDAVEAHERVEAGGCPRQDTGEPEGHEPPDTRFPLLRVTGRESHGQEASARSVVPNKSRPSCPPAAGPPPR